MNYEIGCFFFKTKFIQKYEVQEVQGSHDRTITIRKRLIYQPAQDIIISRKSIDDFLVRMFACIRKCNVY